MKGGSVEFDFKGNTSDIEKKASGLSGSLKSLVSTGTATMVSLGTIASAVLIRVTKEAITSAGELEQQIGGTEAVFGEFSKIVQNDASLAFDKMGVSANDYMQYINKMGALMKGSGIETQEAMKLSSEAMQRAADVASIMGISVDDAMTAIAGAAKGNFTMMDNLGVAMNATSLSAYALEKGIGKAYNQMEQGEKIQLAMQMFMEKSSYAAGNYAKENETLVGSLTTLKASFSNLLSGAGTIDDFIASLGNFAQVLLQKLITILPQVTQGIVNLLQSAIPMIASMLPDLIQQLVPVFLQGVTQLVLTLIDILPDLIIMIADMIPELMPQIIEAIMVIIPALIQHLPEFIEAGIELTLGLIKGLILGTAQLIKNIGELASKAISKVKEQFVGKSPLEIGKMLVQGLWNGINNAKQWVLDKIKGFGKSILNGIKKIFGINSPSKEFEIIGRYNVLGLEQGMEKESIKLQDSFDDMFSISPNLYGTASSHLSPQVNVINNINMKQDSLGQMVNDIKTFSGGAKNDYSYGMGA